MTRRAARGVWLALAASAGLAAGCGSEPPAPSAPAAPDLILRNGAVYTVDAARRWASAVAVRDGRIVAVGTDPEVTRLAGPDTRTLDLAGRFVMPAFHDAHVHPLSAGVELGQCNLNDIDAPADVLAAVKACADRMPGDGWLIGGGWALPSFPPGQPNKAQLDAVTGSHPASLSSADGHTTWVNSAALAAAGITTTTPDPDAGRIERDARGEATGVLREAATDLVSRIVPPISDQEREAGLARAVKVLNGFGIVSVQEASARPDAVEAYRALARQGTLTVRARLSLLIDQTQDASQVDALVKTRAATTEAGVVAGSAKIFVDGVIEAATASLIEPYIPLPKEGASPRSRGLPNYTDERLAAIVTRLDRDGFQVHMHAIGDAAIRQGLDAIEAAERANGARDRRPHIAHIQLFDPADIPRFRRLGVIANMQPLWAYADSYIRELTEPRLGPARSRWLYPFGSLERSGAILAGGSDWSVTTANPLHAIQVAVTRKSLTAPADAPAWIPDERLTLPTVLAAYTMGGAYVNFEEQDSGSLEPGKWADLIVLDQNLFEIPAARIHEARVLWTLKEGAEVFRAEGFEGVH
ncbi:MAG: amidohydrolase [Vicinamibacterales bacterium]